MARIRNLTPHEVKIIGENGAIIATFKPTGRVARATQVTEKIGELNGVEIVSMKFGETVDLPEYAEEPRCSWQNAGCEPNGHDCKGCSEALWEPVYYIVSRVTAEAARATGRRTDDLLLTADPVRDGNGQIIGCRRLAQL